MLGESSLGEVALGGEGLDLGVPIIEEVAIPTKALVFVVEIDLFQPELDPVFGLAFWADGTGWVP